MDSQEVTFEEIVLANIYLTLEAEGIKVEVARDEEQFILLDEAAQGQLRLGNITEQAQAAREAGGDWREIVAQWVQYFLTTRVQSNHEYSAEEIRTAIRTRLVSRSEGLSYARPFVNEESGLVVALALDTPTAVGMYTTESLDSAPLSVEELYVLGQANTDTDVPPLLGPVVM